MDEYISKDRAIKIIKGAFQFKDVESPVDYRDIAIETVKVCPALTVVKCWDCKWYEKNVGMCNLHSNNYFPPVFMDWDDFCSKGRKIEDAEIH